MTFVQTMREIPGKDAVLAFTGLLFILAILWTARFNRAFLGGNFSIPPAWTPTIFQHFPRVLLALACWWILFFTGPALLLVGIIARLFGIRMFPVFMPRWLTNPGDSGALSAWFDLNLAKILIGALFLVIDVSMVKLALTYFDDDSALYWYPLTMFWLVFTIAAIRIGLRHFFHHPLSYLGRGVHNDTYPPY